MRHAVIRRPIGHQIPIPPFQMSPSLDGAKEMRSGQLLNTRESLAFRSMAIQLVPELSPRVINSAELQRIAEILGTTQHVVTGGEFLSVANWNTFPVSGSINRVQNVAVTVSPLSDDNNRRRPKTTAANALKVRTATGDGGERWGALMGTGMIIEFRFVHWLVGHSSNYNKLTLSGAARGFSLSRQQLCVHLDRTSTWAGRQSWSIEVWPDSRRCCSGENTVGGRLTIIWLGFATISEIINCRRWGEVQENHEEGVNKI